MNYVKRSHLFYSLPISAHRKPAYSFLAGKRFVLGDQFQIYWDVHDHTYDGICLDDYLANPKNIQ